MNLQRADVGIPYVLRVACPSCDMPINHPCINLRGEPLALVTSHASRWTLVQRMTRSTPALIVLDGIKRIATYHHDGATSGYQLDDGRYFYHTNYTWLRWVENEK